MINLLPQAEKNNIRHEYIVNNISTINVFLFILILIADVLMISMLLLIFVDNKEVATDLDILIERNLDEKREYSAVIKDLNKKLSTLSNGSRRGAPKEIIREVIEIKPDGIKVDSITYDSLPRDTDNPGFIRLDGEARRRSDLISFRKLLTQTDAFEDVDAPISALARGEDINFSFRLNLLK